MRVSQGKHFGPSAVQKLASAIAKREGGKSQARVGDIREILKILVVMQCEYLKENPDQGDAGSPLGILATRAKIIRDTKKKLKEGKASKLKKEFVKAGIKNPTAEQVKKYVKCESHLRQRMLKNLKSKLQK